MKIIDLNDDHIYTLVDLKRDWESFVIEDPENHAPDFRTELFEILMATVNGRNDLEIIGLTPLETDRLITWLRNLVLK